MVVLFNNTDQRLVQNFSFTLAPSSGFVPASTSKVHPASNILSASEEIELRQMRELCVHMLRKVL